MLSILSMLIPDSEWRCGDKEALRILEIILEEERSPLDIEQGQDH
jgi:hypothetical protein